MANRSETRPEAGRWRRWAGVLQIEDLLLFVWFAFGEPLLERLVSRLVPEDLPARLEQGGSPLAGGILLGAAALAVICLLTRDAAEESLPGQEGWMTPATYARLPMLVVLAILADRGFEQFGSDLGDRLFPWIVVVAVGPVLIQPWLPTLPYLLRRGLMLPTVAVGALLFSATLESTVGGLDLSVLAHGGDSTEVAGAQFAAVIAAVASLLYYVLFVFAPRQVAAGPGSWTAWLLRFPIFVAGMLVSLIWGAPWPGGV